MRRFNALLCALFVFCGSGATASLLVSAPSAAASTAYTPEPPIVDEVSGGPWNTSQGDPSQGGEYPTSDLLPTFNFGGPETTLGGVSEPNMAVYPGTGSAPYPSGVVGTPGPLDGYCGGGNNTTEQGGAPVSQPAGSTLPFAPYYFPDIVRNADGSLTGYFDYRPKDADEAITVARSTNNGKTWTTEGKALEQSPGYCPTADTNDDGDGHPYVMPVGTSNFLYTLQRAAGDYPGVGLLVHTIGAESSSDPLSGTPVSGQPPAAPAQEQVGDDPNTFASATNGSITLGTTAQSIPVTTLGTPGTLNSIVAGPYVDYTQSSPTGGSKPVVITCTGTTTSPSPELTGCTIPSTSSLTVGANDDLVQVVATANVTGGYVVDASSAQTPAATGGVKNLTLATGSTGRVSTTANSDGLLYQLNLNAPNRIYIDGRPVYCTQSNANPATTKLEYCTSPAGQFTAAVGDVITGDPMTPPSATMTTGLLSPDGIVGTAPYRSTFNGQSVPSGDKIVLYTEKIANYFLEGEVNGTVSASTYTAPGSGTITITNGTSYTFNYSPFATNSAEPLPGQPGGPPSGSFTIYLGTSGTAISAFTCTGWAAATQSGVPVGSENLVGCTTSNAPSGSTVGATADTATALGAGTGGWVGGLGAAIDSNTALALTGEGKTGSSAAEKLLGNNEDYKVLRAAYTSNGVNFTDLGTISGNDDASGSYSNSSEDNGTYNDISNPYQQASPAPGAPGTDCVSTCTAALNLAPGTADTVELRWPGSRGTIVTNPDGTLGMFLSGAWGMDGDSDAFNQIFYASSSDGGQTWSVPKVVLSTEYNFAASVAQDKALAEGKDEPLGISGYYSGRAYGPAVVQNPNGSLTMVFSGYRLPKPLEKVGTVLGTNPSAQYTIGAKDPALYRNILTMQLTSVTSPGVTTTTSVSSSDAGSGVVGSPVTYTANVSVNSPGTGTPTGRVSFSDSNGPISGCTGLSLNESTPDTAACATQHEHPPGSDEITATYSGDSNYAGSAGTTSETVDEAPAITSADSTTYTEGDEGSFSVTAAGFPAPTISETGTLPGGVELVNGVLSGIPTEEGTFPITLEASNNVGSPATQNFTLTVDAPPAITSPDEATFTDHASSLFAVTATGTPAPTITKWGTLPEGVTFANGVISGTPTQTGRFEITLTAANGIGADSTQQFTLTVVGLHVTTASLPEVALGASYGAQLESAGGLNPIKWSKVSGKLPLGLKLSSTGAISGTVGVKKYAPGTSFSFTVKATDSAKRVHQTATASFTLVIS